MELRIAERDFVNLKRIPCYDSFVVGLSGQVYYQKALCSQIALVPLSPELIVKSSLSFGCSIFAFLIMFDLPVCHLQQICLSSVSPIQAMLQMFMLLWQFIYSGNCRSFYNPPVFILNVCLYLEPYLSLDLSYRQHGFNCNIPCLCVCVCTHLYA